MIKAKELRKIPVIAFDTALLQETENNLALIEQELYNRQSAGFKNFNFIIRIEDIKFNHPNFMESLSDKICETMIQAGYKCKNMPCRWNGHLYLFIDVSISW
jgi:hypothetical protein